MLLDQRSILKDAASSEQRIKMEVIPIVAWGMACDLYRKHRKRGWFKRWERENHSQSSLPIEVCKWFGITDALVQFTKKEIDDHSWAKYDAIAVWQLNDVKKFTFDRIADLLERKYLTNDS